MSLSSGIRVGAYEIVARLGAGAMGDVYRARDTRLGRDVAIKVLPESLANDPERLTRFEREAKSLAALNHPNIAHIYGVEDATSGSALVMELVPGQDLRERMNAGPMPLSEAAPIAQQIAAGLEAAHEAGIIHRDLKPANIRVRDDGVVKVLDFGLAKALSSSSTAVVDQQSIATVTSPDVTRQGIVLGTAAYMSPEQARGRDVDKRSDIWAFGVVLYEMLSGRRLFADETLSDTIAAVLTRSIDLTLLPATTPPHVRSLIARCLERDAKRRLRDIGEARIALEMVAEGSTHFTDVVSPARATHSTTQIWRMLAMIAAGIAIGAAAVMLWKPEEPAPTPSTRLQFDLSPPPGTELRLSSRPAMAISADGTLIAITAVKEGVSRIYVRRRDEVEMKEIPGTEGMSNPAFSPDGTWLTAVTEGEITKFRPDGNGSVQLAVTARASRGTTWLGNDAVVFGVPAGLGLQIVSASGGTARPLTELDRTRGERTHRWPAVVPGNKAVLFTVGTAASPDDYNDSQVDAVIVATGERRKVLDAASMVRCTSDGRLIYARLGALYVVGFDVEQLRTIGEPDILLTGVEGDGTTGASHFTIAEDGTLLFVPGQGATNRRRLVWADLKGGVEPLAMEPAYYNDPDVSPDGQRIATVIGSTGRGDVWVHDRARKQTTRLTFDGHAATPRWSRDSRSIYYMSPNPAAGSTTLRRVDIDSGGTGSVLATLPGRAYLGSINSDGTFAVVSHLPEQDGIADLAKVEFNRDPASARTQPITNTPMAELGPSLSRDSRLVVYTSAAAGQPDVYVRELDGPGQWQITTSGGIDARWSPDGQAIFYRVNNQQMKVPVQLSPRFRPGVPQTVLNSVPNWFTETGATYGIDPVTGRFLLIHPPADAAGSRFPATIRVLVAR